MFGLQEIEILKIEILIIYGSGVAFFRLTFQKKLVICFNDNRSKMKKNPFYFILKALFLLKIFKF